MMLSAAARAEMGTCFERLATLQATGKHMAVRDRFKWKAYNWSEVHWDWGASLIIECAYMLALEQHADPEHFNQDQIDTWNATGRRFAAQYFPHEQW